MKFLRNLLLLLLAFAFAGILNSTYAQQPSTTGPPRPAGAPSPAAAPIPAATPSPAAASTEWQRYELGNGAYSVLLPSKPKEEKNPPTPELSLMYVATVESSNFIFVSQYARFATDIDSTPELKAIFYDGAWKGIREEFDKAAGDRSTAKVVLRDQKETSFAGRPAREINYTLGPMLGRVFMTLSGPHAYVVMVMRKDQTSVAEEEKFLNSFQLKLPATLMQHH